MTTWDLLLPTIPHRHDLMLGFLEEIDKQWQPGLGVIVLRDNLQRRHVASYAKWQDLEEMSTADYTSFISDDDFIAPDFVSKVMAALEGKPDFVGFRIRYMVDGEIRATSVHSLANGPEWRFEGGGYKRGIGIYNPIRRDLALLAAWATDHQEADRTWADDLHATGKVNAEVFIDEELYWYRETSESWSQRREAWPEPLPADEIPAMPEYPWLTVRDECFA